VDFKLFGFHQTARRQIKPGLYAGLGYHLDLFSGIKDTGAQAGEQTPFQAYGVGTKGSSTSSGIPWTCSWNDETIRSMRHAASTPA